MKNFKSEKGYVDGGLIFIIVFVLIIVGFLIAIFGNLCLDFASGSHRIIPTAIDNDIWGNYKVYFKTSEYTKNSEEDFYYIDKDNKELAKEMRDYIKQGDEVIVYYDKYVGLKGFSAPSSAPITRIEKTEN